MFVMLESTSGWNTALNTKLSWPPERLKTGNRCHKTKFTGLNANDEDRTYHGMFNSISLRKHTEGWLMKFHQISYVNCVMWKPQNITLVKGNIWQAVSSLLTNSMLGNLANDIINTTYLTDLHLQFIRKSFSSKIMPSESDQAHKSN